MWDFKPGALHKMLQINENKALPKALLLAITKAHPGETIRNPCLTGRSQYQVSDLMRKRAWTALTLKEIERRR